ncbi:disease resistance protein RUN1-like [Carya illinoinensis]|uniref:disease resistance protein RUN1-like n=1 Tax=Carya illinoinensis TaxID=32201 RepID=UPI001C729248|nr:disease resistance protein RUN1-like [Carya illinoinensis]
MDVVGNLISLEKFQLHGIAIRKLYASIGSLPYLKHLSARNCLSLSKLLDSIEGLASLVELLLAQTPITNLSDQVGALKMLRKLEMRNCKDLKFLPESIGSMFTLTSLNISNSNISEFPESIGMLENLELPEIFGMLSSLMILERAKKPDFLLVENRVPREDLGVAEKEKHNPFRLLASFSNSCSIEELDTQAWNLCVANRIALERVSDMSKLESLRELNLANCEKVEDILGLKCMKSLTSTMPKLKGVPKMNEDQIYLFRYPDCHLLVSKLRDGYDINVRGQDPPFINGIEVKKCGLYLIFKGDNDYKGDEESLDKS